jgi:hypothetical protein
VNSDVVNLNGQQKDNEKNDATFLHGGQQNSKVNISKSYK